MGIDLAAKAVPSVTRYSKWLITSTYTASEFNLKGAMDWVTTPGPFERSFEVNRVGSMWEITEMELRAEPVEGG